MLRKTPIRLERTKKDGHLSVSQPLSTYTNQVHKKESFSKPQDPSTKSVSLTTIVRTKMAIGKWQMLLSNPQSSTQDNLLRQLEQSHNRRASSLQYPNSPKPTKRYHQVLDLNPDPAWVLSVLVATLESIEDMASRSAYGLPFTGVETSKLVKQQ